jgi:RNA polymerase sigma-70 factor (ECF subfamily)
VADDAKRIVEGYLVGLARLGDRVAQEALVTRFHRRFLRHAYRLLGDAAQAADVVQDGWLQIFRSLPKLRDDAAFPAWAFRVITRRCARHIAGLRRNRAIVQGVLTEPTVDADVENGGAAAAERHSLRRALAQLPAGQRAAIALFYLEEMSVAEVAVALEVPVGTVKSRLLNARKKLRGVLEGEDHG